MSIASLAATVRKKSGKSTKRIVENILLTNIIADDQQPRKHFDEESLRGLAESIKEQGILCPLMVTVGKKKGTYGLIEGERRLRALKLLKRKDAPCLVYPTGTKHQNAILQLVVNNQREEINSADQSLFVARLKKEFGVKQKQLATDLGLSESNVSKMIHIAKVLNRQDKRADYILKLVRENTIKGLSPLYEYCLGQKKSSESDSKSDDNVATDSSTGRSEEQNSMSRATMQAKRMKKSRNPQGGVVPEVDNTSEDNTNLSKNRLMQKDDFIHTAQRVRFSHNGTVYSDGKVKEEDDRLTITFFPDAGE